MFLSTMPLWLSGIIIVDVTTLIVMSGPALIRRCAPRKHVAMIIQRAQDNRRNPSLRPHKKSPRQAH
jgi:hypothetical protein